MCAAATTSKTQLTPSCREGDTGVVHLVAGSLRPACRTNVHMIDPLLMGWETIGIQGGSATWSRSHNPHPPGVERSGQATMCLAPGRQYMPRGVGGGCQKKTFKSRDTSARHVSSPGAGRGGEGGALLPRGACPSIPGGHRRRAALWCTRPAPRSQCIPSLAACFSAEGVA